MEAKRRIIIFPNLFSELFWECRHKRNQNLVNLFIRKIKFVKTLIGSLAVIESSDDIDGDYHYDNSFSSPNYVFFFAIICYDYYHLECLHEGNQFKESPNIIDFYC